MKKIFVALFLGVFVIFGVGANCLKNSNTTNTPAKTASVSIKNSSFVPATITVDKGTVVTWTNNDIIVYQIESDGNLPDLLSGELDPNDTYSFTFNQTGTFAYHCNIHSNITSQVIVQ